MLTCYNPGPILYIGGGIVVVKYYIINNGNFSMYSIGSLNKSRKRIEGKFMSLTV